MSDTLMRLGILALVGVLLLAIIWGGRLFVARQKRLALAGAPAENGAGRVRILAFSSADCTQCHTLQQPALHRLQASHGDKVDVVEIDAPGSPDLARRYHILTVPSTVVLNAAGEAHAINYGFANLHKLQQQIDAVLA
ncbi:MAG TPA: thioredoxin family protein [Ktedonobacteraceae bacterium]